MKSNYFIPKVLSSILVILGFSTFFFSSCNDDSGIIGIDIIPPGDQIMVHFDNTSDISSRTVYVDSIRSDESNFSSSRNYSLLGSYIDPVFGKTRADFITQVRLSSNLVDFGEDFYIDSLILFLDLQTLYGDPRQYGSQEISVYQLTDTISKDEIYYSNLNIDDYYDDSQLLGHLNIKPSLGDSIIAIKINPAPFVDLLSDTSNLVDNETFLKIFKGLYITTNQVDFVGSVMSFALLSDYSRLRLYYHNYPGEFPLVPATASSKFDFLINENCARVNLFYHDYEGAANPIQNINDTIAEDSLVYVQAMGGLKVKVDLNDINKWQDSIGVVINSANLIVPVLDNSTDIFSPLQLLTLSYINDNGDNVIFPDLFHNGAFFQDYFKGTYNSVLHAYEFNIALYIQGLIDGSLPMHGFYIHPYSTESTVLANRTILKGAKATNGMRIHITYMKL